MTSLEEDEIVMEHFRKFLLPPDENTTIHKICKFILNDLCVGSSVDAGSFYWFLRTREDKALKYRDYQSQEDIQGVEQFIENFVCCQWYACTKFCLASAEEMSANDWKDKTNHEDYNHFCSKLFAGFQKFFAVEDLRLKFMEIDMQEADDQTVDEETSVQEEPSYLDVDQTEELLSDVTKTSINKNLDVPLHSELNCGYLHHVPSVDNGEETQSSHEWRITMDSNADSISLVRGRIDTKIDHVSERTSTSTVDVTTTIVDLTTTELTQSDLLNNGLEKSDDENENYDNFDLDLHPKQTKCEVSMTSNSSLQNELSSLTINKSSVADLVSSNQVHLVPPSELMEVEAPLEPIPDSLMNGGLNHSELTKVYLHHVPLVDHGERLLNDDGHGKSEYLGHTIRNERLRPDDGVEYFDSKNIET
jgi:hypothetical protein